MAKTSQTKKVNIKSRKAPRKQGVLKVKSLTAAKATTDVFKKTVKNNKDLIPSESLKVKSEIEKLEMPLFSVDGVKSGKLKVIPQIFALKNNSQLISQAIRVYLSNQRSGTANAKTRAEVNFSTKKIYKQKGTGRARHGSRKAPIFVKGGVTFPPKPRDYSLKLPVKMKKAALLISLSNKFKENQVFCIDGLSTIEPKTKIISRLLRKIVGSEEYILLIVSTSQKQILKAAGNIRNVQVIVEKNLYSYPVLLNKYILFSREALTDFSKRNNN